MNEYLKTKTNLQAFKSRLLIDIEYSISSIMKLLNQINQRITFSFFKLPTYKCLFNCYHLKHGDRINSHTFFSYRFFSYDIYMDLNYLNAESYFEKTFMECLNNYESYYGHRYLNYNSQDVYGKLIDPYGTEKYKREYSLIREELKKLLNNINEYYKFYHSYGTCNLNNFLSFTVCIESLFYNMVSLFSTNAYKFSSSIYFNRQYTKNYTNQNFCKYESLISIDTIKPTNFISLKL